MGNNRGLVGHAEGFEGSPVDLYRRLVDLGESEVVHRVAPANAAILELGCGTGRMTRALLALGHPVTAVDNDPEMLSSVPARIDKVLSDIETLDLARPFPVVLLASNLINSPRSAVRRALLQTCRRHVSDDGVVVLQRYQPELRGWKTGDWERRGPVEIRVARFERSGDHFSASIEYRDQGQSWTQHFSAVILDDDMLGTEMASVDLRIGERLTADGTWLAARPFAKSA